MNVQQSTDSAACAAADSVSRSTPRLWFITEIQHMMHGFGDCPRPLPETAALVEEIVYRQMIEILYLAEDVRRQRNSRFINIEEFLYLLRRDKNKLKRLLQYLGIRDMKASAMRGVVLDNDDSAEMITDVRQPQKNRRKICQEFLSIIDNTGELLALLDDNMDDEIKHQRKLRAEIMARNMNTQQYLEFCEARQASFTPRYKTPKFKEWLLSNVTTDIKLSPYAVEILSYLAYETVAQIVDLALTVRRDTNVTIDDPFSREIAPVYCGLSALASSSGEQINGATSVNASCLSSSSVQSQNIITSNAITPSEIREALRRYTQPIGPFADFSKEPLLPCTHRHLSC